MASVFSAAQAAAFAADGYVIVRQLFDQEEIALMAGAIEQDPDLQKSFYDRKDAQGKATKMATWNHPGDSVYGLAARSHRVVDTVEQMLGGEVYHYHSKLTAKEPLEGGAWEWHQDYGYWYHNGCLLPHMASVMVGGGAVVAMRMSSMLIRGERVGAVGVYPVAWKRIFVCVPSSAPARS
jgi:ectoine hydroxylase-related dioxygenase (phytanoyl-CoA dioxygenase family)